MKEKLLNSLPPIIFLSVIVAAILTPLYFTGVIGRPLKVGDYYIEDYEHDNPFIAHETNVVLAVKNGYVSFRNKTGDWNSRVSNFRSRHTYVGHVPPPTPPLEDPQ
jgi:hypothetical protein